VKLSIMMFKKNLFLILLLAVSLVLAGCTEGRNPKVTLTPERLQHKGWVKMHGEGFTAMSDVRSHLKRPDGTEFPILPMLTDSKGEIFHEIDTLLLQPGVHEVWVIDSATKASSNVAKFEVTLGPVDN
jgi:hypothetical protein